MNKKLCKIFIFLFFACFVSFKVTAKNEILEFKTSSGMEISQSINIPDFLTENNKNDSFSLFYNKNKSYIVTVSTPINLRKADLENEIISNYKKLCISNKKNNFMQNKISKSNDVILIKHECSSKDQMEINLSVFFEVNNSMGTDNGSIFINIGYVNKNIKNYKKEKINEINKMETLKLLTILDQMNFKPIESE